MPELYEVVGSILRDIAQARCLSDLYSRDVSRYYAEDRVLRYFPVPRTEITEASFTVSFLIREVVVDPTRMNIRNARLSQVFERYASEIVRAALTKARSILDEIGRQPDLTQEQQAALTAFANGFLSEDYRNILRARFVRSDWRKRITRIDVAFVHPARDRTRVHVPRAIPGSGEFSFP